MSTLTPICVACRLEMRCVKNDRLVCDPSTDQFPSTYWLGDEYKCPDCGNGIVTGFGKALASHPGVADEKEKDALQFDYERPAALMLHLELKAASGPADDASSYMPLRLPANVGIAEINLESARRIPLLAFGDVHKPIALLSVSLPHGTFHWSGPRILKAEGTGAGPGHEDSHSLWMPIAAGGVVGRASLWVRDLLPVHPRWEVIAISLELAAPQSAQPAAEGQQKGGEG